jgi:phage terminase large subunit-like protein
MVASSSFSCREGDKLGSINLKNKEAVMIEAFKRFKQLETLDYHPFYYQKSMHASTNPMVFMQMPNQVGKSMAAAMEAVFWFRGYHPYKKLKKTNNLTIWLCSDTLGSVIEALWEKKLSKIIPESEYRRVIEVGQFVGVEHKLTKNRITFKAFAKGYTRLQSVPVDLVLIDEMPPYKIFMELLQRTRVTKGQIYMTFTPLRPEPELKALIYNPRADVEIIRATTYDCPLYTEEEIEKAKAMLSDREFRVRWLGDWASYEGALIPSFGDDCIVDDFEVPTSWNKMLCIDPATSGYVGLAIIAVDPDTGTAYVVKEKMPKGVAPSDSVDDAEEFASEYIVDSRVSDIHENWFVKEAKKKGIAYRGVKKRSREEMTVELDSSFASGSLKVFKSCELSQKQFLGYSNKEGADKFDPVRGEFHILDAVKYGNMVKHTLKPRVIEEYRHEHSYLWDEIRGEDAYITKKKKFFRQSR